MGKWRSIYIEDKGPNILIIALLVFLCVFFVGFIYPLESLFAIFEESVLHGILYSVALIYAGYLLFRILSKKNKSAFRLVTDYIYVILFIIFQTVVGLVLVTRDVIRIKDFFILSYLEAGLAFTHVVMNLVYRTITKVKDDNEKLQQILKWFLIVGLIFQLCCPLLVWISSRAKPIGYFRLPPSGYVWHAVPILMISGLILSWASAIKSGKKKNMIICIAMLLLVLLAISIIKIGIISAVSIMVPMIMIVGSIFHLVVAIKNGDVLKIIIVSFAMFIFSGILFCLSILF